MRSFSAQRDWRKADASRPIIDLSTTGPGMAIAFSKGLEERGIAWIDAPVSGGIAGARDGKLAVMVSGPKAATKPSEPLLANFGRLFFVGEKAGLAQVAKLANNLLAASALVVTSEAMVMGVKAGIDPKVLLDIINASSGRNSATQDKFPRAVLGRTFDFGFATGLSYKDVRLCIDEAEAMGVPMVAGVGRPPDACRYECEVRRGFRFHLDRKGRGGMGRRRSQRMSAAARDLTHSNRSTHHKAYPGGYDEQRGFRSRA